MVLCAHKPCFLMPGHICSIEELRTYSSIEESPSTHKGLFLQVMQSSSIFRHHFNLYYNIILSTSQGVYSMISHVM